MNRRGFIGSIVALLVAPFYRRKEKPLYVETANAGRVEIGELPVCLTIECHHGQQVFVYNGVPRLGSYSIGFTSGSSFIGNW